MIPRPLARLIDDHLWLVVWITAGVFGTAVGRWLETT